MVSWGISAHADLRRLMKSALEGGLVGFFRSARSSMVKNGSQVFNHIISGSYQATDLVMVNILSLLLPSNPLSFSTVWQGAPSCMKRVERRRSFPL